MRRLPTGNERFSRHPTISLPTAPVAPTMPTLNVVADMAVRVWAKEGRRRCGAESTAGEELVERARVVARGEEAGAKPYAVDVVMANRAPMAVLNFIVCW